MKHILGRLGRLDEDYADQTLTVTVDCENVEGRTHAVPVTITPKRATVGSVRLARQGVSCQTGFRGAEETCAACRSCCDRRHAGTLDGSGESHSAAIPDARTGSRS